MRVFLILALFAGFDVIEYGMAYTTQQRYGLQEQIEDFDSNTDDLIGYNHDEENVINTNAEGDESIEFESMQPGLAQFDFELQQAAEIQNNQRYVIGEAGVTNAHNDPNCNEYNGYTRDARVDVKKKPCRPHCKNAKNEAARLVREDLTNRGKGECVKYVQHKGCKEGPAC